MFAKRPAGLAVTCLLGGFAAATPCGAQTAGAPAIAAGNARFEFLTPSLVRMEYSPSATFVDAPTAVVQKREWPAAAFTRGEKAGWLVAATSAVTLRYRLGSGPFTAANLSVTWKDRLGAEHQWHPGQVDSLNLGGLTYSLDNISEANLPKDLPKDQTDLESPVNDEIPGIDLVLPRAKPGLLSRSGYALVDDSSTPVWNAARTWIAPRPQQNGQDWYLFVYDRDYRQVLSEYAELCGGIPMIPRFVLGPWITDFNFEYFPGTPEAAQPDLRRYNQQHLVEEVTRLRNERIPFDTLVLDFAWHNYGWQGGYDWSPLIAHPDGLMRSLHAQGIKLSLNDHPGYINTDESILSYDDSHASAVLHALGRPLPAKPSFERDLSRLWSFAPDSGDVGLREHWYAADEHDTRWRPIRTGLPWQQQGYPNYQGIGWYRAFVPLPVRLPDKLYLDLGEVGKSYRVFVNGRELAHSPDHWPRRLTYTDLSAYVSGGRRNTIVLRVEPDAHRSGILRGPVAIRDVAPPERIWFDLSDRLQAEVFMRELHGPLMQKGVDVWWVDGGSGAVAMPGLNAQLWTNKVFYDFSQQQTGRRAFILSRYGDWGSERYPGFFTGDAYSQWPVLAYQVAFSARGGNVLVPYISHDIGGFHGGRIDFDLYARWIEFGTFSAILRMHSAYENPREGNLRMPWVYGKPGVELMRKYLQLRTQLLPYLYTYTWLAHQESMPILRPLYLEYPDLEEAYRHPHEYFFGEQMLVAPVLEPSGDHSVYLPPGEWREFFNGRRYQGARTLSAHYAVDETPVFVREGAIIPEQPAAEYSNARPPDRLLLTVFGAGEGSFDLYEDDGISLRYPQQQAHTQITHTLGTDGRQRLIIGPTHGSYAGQPPARSYQVRIFAADKPVAVSVDGKDVGSWSWEPQQGLAVVELASRPIGDPVSVAWR